jgi:sialidase-1
MTESQALLSDVSTGILYKNSKPHVRSVHAYFPSVAAMPSGEWLAIYTLGEAFEAVNLRTCVGRSDDGGQTWRHEGPLYPGRTDRLMSDVGKMSMAPDGELVVNLARHDRTDHPEEGLTNPATMGFVPTEMLLVRSRDGGRTWSEPAAIEPPLVGPCFEICSPVTFLRDGRWVLPTSTWLDWEGNLPNGNRMVALVSSDRGRTWPAYLDVMHSPDDNLIFWESKIVELSDGRLLAVAWCYDRAANADRPNVYSISHDGGATWSAPESTGLLGQTLTPCVLGDDRVLCVYRRMDERGLWAAVARLEGDRWCNEGCQPLWGHRAAAGETRLEEKMVDTFHGQNVSVIRWIRFRAS